MIKLLVVDDEEEIRTGISSVIDWEAYGIEICGEAENGRKALDLIERLSPDIILVDIRMPVMDGLQVIETLHSKNSPVRSVILSGYDDFSYAQRALKSGASDYLLKPCRPQEILETVLRIKTLIENENEREEKLRLLKVKFKESLPLLKEKFLARLLSGSSFTPETLVESINFFGINLTPSGQVAVAVFRIDEPAGFSKNGNSTDTELMKFSVMNIASELIGAKLPCEVLEYGDDLAAIISIQDNIYENMLPSLLDKVKTSISTFLHFTLSIGVGRPHNIQDEVYLSLEEALKALDFKFFTGDNSIIMYEDIREYAAKEPSYPINEEKELLNNIKTHRIDKLEESIEKFISAVREKHGSKDYLLKAGLALLFSIYHLCIENSLETTDIFGAGLSGLDNILQADTLAGLKAELYNIASVTAEKLNNKRSRNSIVEFMVRYINENCHNDISLEVIANEAYISPGYASLLFKQNIGINFVDYLHKARIEKACSLLKDIRLKIYEVSSIVGYNDEKYFSQVFKKYKGVTPSQYREGLVL